jgi:hypothetical protein
VKAGKRRPLAAFLHSFQGAHRFRQSSNAVDFGFRRDDGVAENTTDMSHIEAIRRKVFCFSPRFPCLTAF